MTTLQISNEEREQRRALDELLEMASTREAPERYSLPEMLGDYQRVEGKPGWYVLPMCLEVELRALEFVSQIRAENESNTIALLRTAIDLASMLLYRVDLPNDRDAAMEKLQAYLRGEGEILRPVSQHEIGRAFKSSEELINVVLKPLGLWSEGEAKNE